LIRRFAVSVEGKHRCEQGITAKEAAGHFSFVAGRPVQDPTLYVGLGGFELRIEVLSENYRRSIQIWPRTLCVEWE
jgi:hypothetical protein